MRTTRLKILFRTDDTEAAFSSIARFERFPDLAEDVRSVVTQGPSTGDAARNSDWVVNFRRGVMRWNEWETVDPAALRIEFGQTDGDFADFSGWWQLTEVADGCELCFEVTYDFGIESLVGIMDPIAERVITRVICSVVRELFRDVNVVEGGDALTDLAGGKALTPAGGPS